MRIHPIYDKFGWKHYPIFFRDGGDFHNKHLYCHLSMTHTSISDEETFLLHFLVILASSIPSLSPSFFLFLPFSLPPSLCLHYLCGLLSSTFVAMENPLFKYNYACVSKLLYDSSSMCMYMCVYIDYRLICVCVYVCLYVCVDKSVLNFNEQQLKFLLNSLFIYIHCVVYDLGVSWRVYRSSIRPLPTDVEAECCR